MHASLLALCGYKQFIVYKIVPTDQPGKTDKFPCDYRTGKIVNAQNPDNWTDADTAERTAAKWGSGWGVGFVFTALDPFWFLDLDNHFTPATADTPGSWSPLALQLFHVFNGCAVEISASGTGAHIFGSGIIPSHSCKNVPLGLELYHEGRFVALTGNGAMGDVSTDASSLLPWLVENLFPAGPETQDRQTWTDGPCEGWRGPVEDAELIRRAMQSRSTAAAFTGKAAFAELWLADERALGQTYPNAKGAGPYDASGADMALAMHLAFWTGKDCARMERLMWESRLVRPKWDEREGYYIPRTVLRACARQDEVICDADPLASPVSVLSPTAPSVTLTVTSEQLDITLAGLTERSGATSGILNREHQPQHFTGCVYVTSLHRAFVPGGDLLKPEQFRVRFGGYRFVIDHTNEKTTRDAWEAWTQNEVYRCPQVFGTCFRPDLPSGHITQRNGQTFVNVYMPVEVPRITGDPAPFLEHLARVLPNEQDRAILLAYMAACVQHQGAKFQWAPLLQGVEGNGKTLFARCVAEAIGRRYVHFPPANEISEKFNSWLFDTIFIGVEDIYVPNQKQEIFEILKPMITSDYLAKRAMQTDQVMREVVANFIFNSNHKDGLRKTKNDRRICTFFCHQQQIEDLERDGLTSSYFSALYDWLKKQNGYAIVTDFLYSYAIPDALNPAKDCQRAPITSSTEEAISSGVGVIEQELEESIAQGLPGFAGGWISSIWLDRKLEHMGLMRKVSHQKRKEMLQQLGFIPHPRLYNGRVNNVVMPDGGKPRLYVRKDSLHLQITDAAGVAHAYETANTNRVHSPGLAFGTR